RAVGEVSVHAYVERRGDRELVGLFQEAADAYAGEDGFLGRHRLKVYGYLELAFKVGRNVTIGGFSGLFKDRTWHEVDDALEAARRERPSTPQTGWHHVRVKPGGDSPSGQNGSAEHIVLDVRGTGIRYRPGARCSVLPENTPERVAKTLRALRARGDEPIRLNTMWQEAISQREGCQGAKVLSLRTLLRFGQIRPMRPSTIRALFTITGNAMLHRIIEAQGEDQWELWDLLEVISTGGFDPTYLWKAHPGDRGSICWLVPPELPRMYSISSAAEHRDGARPTELHLMVGQLRYQTPETEVSVRRIRCGTASSFLAHASCEAEQQPSTLAVKVVHPPRFSLPPDGVRPIVMIAGGTGIAPFRSFLRERAQQQDAGEAWLFFATRTSREFHYQKELANAASTGRVHVKVGFSREDAEAKVAVAEEGGRFVVEPGKRQHIGDLLLQEENARLLWHLLRSKEEGGAEGYFYVCGQAGFAGAVMETIDAIFRRFAPGSEHEKEQAARQALYRLVAEGRYMQEVFTTYTGSHAASRKRYDISEVVLHNDEENGYWMIIDGHVYDLTEFIHLHPGGFKILHGYVGMDATIAFERVRHHVHPEVHSMLDMYEIGTIRRLDLAAEWGVAVRPNGLQSVSLNQLYRAWIHFLYLVVEMENALHNDFTIRDGVTTRLEPPTSRSPYKMQLVIEVHKRFMLNYIRGLSGELLEELWTITAGLCATSEDARWMQRTIEALWQTQEARTVENLLDTLESNINSRDTPEGKLPDWLLACCEVLEAEDKQFLHEMKLLLREGVRVFEELEHDTIAKGSDHLLEVIKRIPEVLQHYFTRVLKRSPQFP
ncbi:MAG: hypothetical protein M3220_11275, partial [Chloroflexota bacterium]|nr:hypothetical protein [Chloroflexota bacterium]